MPYKGQDTEKLPSSKVWGQFPVKQASCMIGGEYRIADFRDAAMHDDTGTSVSLKTNDVNVVSGDIRSTNSANADFDIIRTLGDGHPVLQWTPADSDAAVFGPQLSFDFSAGRPWAFECRLGNADASDHSLFAGICSLNGVATTTLDAYTDHYIVADGGALYASRAHVGFHKEQGEATVFAMTKDHATADNAGYHINGSDSALESAASISAVKTLSDISGVTDAHFVKLGMNSDGARIRFFVDNVEVGNYAMGSSELPSGSEDAGVPDYDRNMAPVLAVNGSSADLVCVDWVAFGYLI